MKLREAFDAWSIRVGLHIDHEQAAWEAWQEASALVAEECAKVCDDIYLYGEDDGEDANRCGAAIRAKFKETT